MLKYCRRISKETNIAFVVMWAFPILEDLLFSKTFNPRIIPIWTIAIISSYMLMVFIVKKTIWDKRKTINNGTKD